MYNLAAAPKSQETHGGGWGETVKERSCEYMTSRNDREALPMIPQQYGCLNKSGRSTTPRDMLTWKRGRGISWGKTSDVDKELELT